LFIWIKNRWIKVAIVETKKVRQHEADRLKVTLKRKAALLG
jgi:hypothetical protein